MNLDLDFYINNIISIDPYASKKLDNYKPLIKEIYDKYAKLKLLNKCDKYLNYNCNFENENSWGCQNCNNCEKCRCCENCNECVECWECFNCNKCSDMHNCENCNNCKECDTCANQINKVGMI